MDREEFIREFIEEYRSFPCLWKVSSVDYNNRVKKGEGYNKLIQIAQKHFPEHSVDIKFVKAKIQNIRTVYKKELNKVESSKRAGAAADHVYTPKLWYFNLLEFTRDQEVSCSSTAQESSNMQQENQASTDASSMENRNSQEVSSTSVTQHSTRPRSPPPTRPRKRAREYERRTNELLAAAKELLQQKPDEFDHIGQTVAYQLQSLTADQRIQYQRILSDLYTEGQLGLLNFKTYLGNHDRPVPPPLPEVYHMAEYGFQPSMQPPSQHVLTQMQPPFQPQSDTPTRPETDTE